MAHHAWTPPPRPRGIMQIIRRQLLAIILAISIISTGCTQKVATTLAVTDYAVGMLRLTSTERGKALPISYSILPSGDSVACKIVFKQVTPGDGGTIAWELQNRSERDGTLSTKANLTSASSTTANDDSIGDLIGVKLTCRGAYYLGDASTFAPLSKLAPVLNTVSHPQNTQETIPYELEWQVTDDVWPSGIDGNSSIAGRSDAVLSIIFTVGHH
jgi:hypothetical protein